MNPLSDSRLLETVNHRSRSRIAQWALLLMASLFVCFYAFAHPVHDFVEYWTAARLLAAHQNPYSIAEVSRMEHALGLHQKTPLMLLSPPWALPLTAPLAITRSYELACFFWMLALIAAVAVSSILLMKVYFGEVRIPEISETVFQRSLFAFTFFPVLLCLRFAQTAPFMLLGLAGFLYFDARRRPFLAGALLSLTLIKPHLVLLVWLGIALHSLRRERWRVLLGSFSALAVSTAIAALFDPHVLRDYLSLARSPYLEVYAAGLGGLVRKAFGGVGTFWIQFVPTVVGVIWFALYWRKHASRWSWSERMPMLLTVSVLTSAYGWAFDQTLLALPVICLAAAAAGSEGRIPSKLVLIYTALNCVLMLTWPFLSVGLLPAPILILLFARKWHVGSQPQLVAAAGA